MEKLYQYAVTQAVEGKVILLILPTPVMAEDEAEVRMIAARAIPEGVLKGVKILVRDF